MLILGWICIYDLHNSLRATVLDQSEAETTARRLLWRSYDSNQVLKFVSTVFLMSLAKIFTIVNQKSNLSYIFFNNLQNMLNSHKFVICIDDWHPCLGVQHCCACKLLPTTRSACKFKSAGALRPQCTLFS